MRSRPRTCRAHAKINLTLEILGKRPDGYHEIVSIVQTLALHDVLSFGPADELVLTCDRQDLATHDNLVLRAARLLQAETGTTMGAQIHLTKRIPVAAGLGGGSSDAACALRGLNGLWQLGLSEEELCRLGGQVGSDVPFFFVDGTALVQGRGEKVSRLPSLASKWVVLITPRVELAEKTRELYARVSPAHFSTGEATRELVRALLQSGDVDSSPLVNAFLPIVLEMSPVVARCLDRLREACAEPFHLSGAGPTFYVLVPDRGRAEELFRSLATLAQRGLLEARVGLTQTV